MSFCFFFLIQKVNRRAHKIVIFIIMHNKMNCLQWEIFFYLDCQIEV